MDNRVELRFDGRRYPFWQRVDIRASVDDLSASTQLAIASPGAISRLGLTANTVAEVLINDVLVSTVRPDRVRRSVSPTSHGISIQARSLARELIDCQYSKTLSGLKLGEIVKRICSTFKVPVKIDAETTVVPDFSMQCEIPANALINAARTANLLLYSQPDGGLILTEPNNTAPVATVEYGYHIKRYDVADEYQMRFSDYCIKSFDYDGGKALQGAVKDSGIGYFRPMHIIADKLSTGLGSLERRAQLERNRRLARAHRIELEVLGWGYERNGVFVPWAINTQIRVIIPDEGIDGVFLISDVGYVQDDKGGSVANLQVVHRDAFSGQERKAMKRGAGVKKSQTRNAR